MSELYDTDGLRKTVEAAAAARDAKPNNLDSLFEYKLAKTLPEVDGARLAELALYVETMIANVRREERREERRKAVRELRNAGHGLAADLIFKEDVT